MDEARLGLKRISRKVWARKRHRPIARSFEGHEWLYLFGFVRPSVGRVRWVLMPRMDAEAFSLVLKHLAETEEGLGTTRRIALLMDSAPGHTSSKLVVPEGIHLIRQPTYSPQVQPAERLWPLVREGLANRAFPHIDDVWEAVEERCRELDEQPHVIRAHTHWHWWPEQRATES